MNIAAFIYEQNTESTSKAPLQYSGAESRMPLCRQIEIAHKVLCCVAGPTDTVALIYAQHAGGNSCPAIFCRDPILFVPPPVICTHREVLP